MTCTHAESVTEAMSNSQRGEFDLTFGGKTLRFKLGTTALQEFQELLGEGGDPPPLPDLMRGVMRHRVKYVRAFLWAGLRKYHPEYTLEDVSDMLDSAEQHEVGALMAGLGISTQPDPRDIADLSAGAEPANPQKAQPKKRTRGTGGTSTATPAASV